MLSCVTPLGFTEMEDYRPQEYGVRAQIIQKNWDIKIVEKSFKTEAERTRWLDAREADGTLHQVLAYSER